MKQKIFNRIINLFFIINAVILIWAILWKCTVPFIGDGTGRIINIIPFRGNTNWEMQLNIFLFVPFGFLLSAVISKKLTWLVLTVTLTSVILEIVQYILAVGCSDITDILLNTLGGFIGIGIYALLVKLFNKHSKVIIMTLCVLIIAFELYMSVSFILFGMVRLGFMMFRM